MALRRLANLRRTEQGVRFLLRAKTVALYLLEPLDYLSRAINGKRHFPPLPLRRSVGPLASLESSGAEFLVYIKLLCQVASSARVLDIGCGFGLMALYLRDFLNSQGSYVGVDVDRKAIRWAQQNITGKDPRFRFLHLDVRNPAFNPQGSSPAEEVRLPFEDGSFDFILLKSVFTHMRPPEVRRYLSETARLLASGGVCLATFFLLNDVQEELRRKGQNRVDFKFPEDGWSSAYLGIPEYAVAYPEHRMLESLQEAGLAVRGVYNGTWSGREDGLSYQDMVLCTKEDGLG